MQGYPTIDTLVKQVRDVRPLGLVATKVIQLTEGERFSAHELATLISSDQALTAKTLRLANSAYYGFPRRITTVRDAVVLLGFRAVRAATLATCLVDAFPGTNTLDYQPFWQSSLAVGTTAELLARAEGARYDEAFTAGVLHNIGMLVLDQAVPRGFAEAVALWREALGREGQISLDDAERSILGFTDAEFGAALTEQWGFPESLVDAVRRHTLNADALPDRGSLAAYVVRARVFVRASGLSDGIDRQPPTEPAEEWAVPPLSVALNRSGGIEGLLERVEAFMDSAVPV